MKLATAALALFALAGLATPAEGQGARLRDPGDPFEILLGIQRDLRLNDVQVERLREIQQRLERANRPHVESLLVIQREVRGQLVAASGSSREDRRRPTAAQVEAAREPMARIAANNLEAMREVNGLLTDEQKRRAAELLQVGSRRLEERRGWMRGRERQ